MKSYIVEAIAVTKSGSYEGPGKQQWIATFASLKEAKAKYTEMWADSSILALLLLEWKAGNIEQSNRPLEHGNHAQRQCDGGCPILTVLAHADKLFVRGGKPCDPKIYADCVGQVLKIGGGNGFLLKSRISDNWITSYGDVIFPAGGKRDVRIPAQKSPFMSCAL
jgi:hypothetical protein